MKNRRFSAVFLISILVLISAITALWIKNSELKEELKECSQYKNFFFTFDGNNSSTYLIRLLRGLNQKKLLDLDLMHIHAQ